MDLGETCRAAWVAACRKATVGRERNPPAERGGAFSDEAVALTISADAEQIVVDELFDGERVVNLNEFEVVGSESVILFRVGSGVAGHLGGADDRPEEDMAIGVGFGTLL